MASNWFLGVAGVTGDSAVEGHENELEVSAWSWAISHVRAPAGSGAGVGRPVLSDLVVTIASTAGALQLVEVCNTGRQVETALLSGVRPGGQPFTFLRYELHRLAVTSVGQVTGDDGSLRHEIALKFRALRATFTPQRPDGSAGTPLRVDVGNPTL